MLVNCLLLLIVLFQLKKSTICVNKKIIAFSTKFYKIKLGLKMMILLTFSVQLLMVSNEAPQQNQMFNQDAELLSSFDNL